MCFNINIVLQYVVLLAKVLSYLARHTAYLELLIAVNNYLWKLSSTFMNRNSHIFTIRNAHVHVKTIQECMVLYCTVLEEIHSLF